ncbi:MAG: C10 family peptidase [Muribaculaceae bacterium]|nr:C10 family peptidase [Muribaculaceae bacterium]
MKKSLILLSLLGAGLFSATAAHISPEQALSRLQKSNRARSMVGKKASDVTLQTTIGDLYIFSADKGYMILPANDEAPALLGYSDEGKFSVKGNPALEYWLSFYNKELSYLNSNQGSKKVNAKAARPQRTPIEPLTKTRWNQGAPYNDDCPMDGGQRSVTGCVATCMAQMMKYHNWPVKGTGSHSYTASELQQTLSFDFGNTTFDWANMPNTYGAESTDDQKAAVANLMYACGVSVDMDYTAQESSASSIAMGQAYINYFGYDQSLWMPMRDYYGLYDWEDMIYENLEKGLPVPYAGQGTAGGHQFICDGYSEDGYFHFNWGWGGMSDGYFLLTALDPPSLGIGGGAGGFNTGQQIALNVKPAATGSTPVYIFYCDGNVVAGEQQVSAGSYMTIMTNGQDTGFFSFSMTTIPAGLKLGARIVSSDGSYDQYISGGTKPTATPTLNGVSQFGIMFPSLPDGTYTITPAFDAGEGWHEIPSPIGNIGSILATVSGGTATLSSPQPATVSVTDITVPPTIYIGMEFPMTFSVVNSNTEEYIGKLIPVLFDADYNMVGQSTYSPVDVLGGATDNVTGYIGKFTATQGNTLSAGTYTMVFMDENGNEVSQPVEVTLAEAPANTTISISNFKLISENPVGNPEEVKFSLDVTCTEGYFAGTLMIAVFAPAGGSSVAADATPTMYINAGETKTVEATLNLSTLEDGNYFAAVFKGQQQQTPPVNFTLSKTTTSVNDILTGESVKEVIYNLQGQKCERPLLPGLYIINGKKVMVK